MEAVQIRALWRQTLIDVRMVSLVVRVGWERESRSEIQLTLQL